jgi:hypothetical protein
MGEPPPFAGLLGGFLWRFEVPLKIELFFTFNGPFPLYIFFGYFV